MHQELPALSENEQFHLNLLNEAAARSYKYPAKDYSGRGIVIPSGGGRYLPCAWVCVNMLRRVGCTLPIEVWHLGHTEMDDHIASLLQPLGVKIVNGYAVHAKHPVRILRGWELKAYALLHSSFEEVLLLDSDNVPVVDPAFLFETPEYARTGAIFWPDYLRTAESRAIWRVTGIPYQDEAEFESGQIVVDKRRCWKALNVAMHINEYSDFYYDYIHGDKDTFRMAWRKIGQEYSMIPHPIHRLPKTMCQHDFDGRRIFQHRNMDKWQLLRENLRVEGFLYEDECLAYLEELRSKHRWMPRGISFWKGGAHDSPESAVAAELAATEYDYHRVGHDRRRMTFSKDGRVGEGAAGCEALWDLERSEGKVLLAIYSMTGRTCLLEKDGEGVWRGHWEVYERMPVELTPTGR